MVSQSVSCFPVEVECLVHKGQYRPQRNKVKPFMVVEGKRKKEERGRKGKTDGSDANNVNL